ncbi:hypothetical protein K1719_041060 [Acacia pycnantha]|nr:hypothetical protein K1719_041060 [Acacia pycnantha]
MHSASGMHIPANLYDTEVANHLYGDLCEGMCLVVIVASLLSLFYHHSKEKMFVRWGRPELISGVRIDVMTEKISEKIDKGIPWPEAQLLSLV